MIKQFQKQIGQAKAQVRQAFLGIVARAGSRSAQLEGLNSEVLQDVEIIQQVGFASWIPKGTKALLLPLGGKTSRSVLIASCNAPIVVEVSEGETCIYDQFGHKILLHKDGIKLVGNTEIDGTLHVKEDITSGAQISDVTSSMQDMRTAYNGHNHGNTPPPDTPMG